MAKGVCDTKGLASDVFIQGGVLSNKSLQV